jgi:hypothetical protein
MRQIEVHIGSSSPLVGPYVRVNVYGDNRFEWGRDFSRKEGLEELDKWILSYERDTEVSADDITKLRKQRYALAIAIRTS